MTFLQIVTPQTGFYLALNHTPDPSPVSATSGQLLEVVQAGQLLEVVQAGELVTQVGSGGGGRDAVLQWLSCSLLYRYGSPEGRQR